MSNKLWTAPDVMTGFRNGHRAKYKEAYIVCVRSYDDVLWKVEFFDETGQKPIVVSSDDKLFEIEEHNDSQ